MFLGTYSASFDDKARLALPEKWRVELAGGLIVTRGPDHCLLVFPHAGFASLVENVEGLGLERGDARVWARFLSGLATDLEIDRQGRICVSDPLRRFAELGENVSLVGVLNRIEIWNPGHYEQLEKDRAPEIAQIGERLHGLRRASVA
jgi:MraZ protein